MAPEKSAGGGGARAFKVSRASGVKNLCRQGLSYCLIKRVKKGPGYYAVSTMHGHLSAEGETSKTFGQVAPSLPTIDYISKTL